MSTRPTDLDVIALRDAMVDEAPPTNDVYAVAQGYVADNRDHKARISKLDALVDGHWAIVWPDDTVTQDMPKVADFISSDLEDLSALVAQAQPNAVSDPENDSPEMMRAALLRSNALATYRHASRLRMTRRQLAMDLAGTGMAALAIWPDYRTPDPRYRYPIYMRLDPRHVYPDPGMGSPDQVTSVVVSYRTKARVLAKQYPHIRQALFATHEQAFFDSSDITVIQYYDSKWCYKLAAWTPQGQSQARTTPIAIVPNLIGCPLVVMASRTTFDGKFRGQFDKALAPLGTANRMMELHLAQLADEIYSEKIIVGVFDNPQDVGPGATLYTTDYQARVDRAKPAGSHSQMYTDIQMLIEQAQQAAGVPAARHGDISQNIASAQYVTAIQGKYITAVQTYQEVIADLEERANELAFKVDVAYLDYPNKALTMTRGGRSFGGTYTPSRDIGDKTANRVIYGAGSGMDSYNRKVSTITDMQAKLISRRTAREQVMDDGDPLEEELEITREALEDSFLMGLQDPAAPLDQRVMALALNGGGKTLSEIAQAMYDAQQQALAAQAQAAQMAQALPAPEVVGPAPAEQPLEQGPPERRLPRLSALRGG